MKNGKISDNNTDIAEELNNLFKNEVTSLNIQANQCIKAVIKNVNDL